MLGWAIADDHDLFSLDEMVAAFDVVDVNSNPARFDQKKADALNAEHIRMLEPADFAGRLRDYFDVHGHRLGLDDTAFATAAELVQTRIVVLADAWDLLKFLNDDEYAIDPKAAAKELGPDAAAVLDAALAALDGVTDWTTAADRAGPQGHAHRQPGPQTAQGLRSDPGRRHGNDGQPAVVRIAGAAGPRPQLAAATRRARNGRRLGEGLACGLCGESLVVCTAAHKGRQRLAAAVLRAA